MHRRYLTTLLLTLVLAFSAPRPDTARAHDVYLAVDNHNDYGWNATTETYDASMLSELDYYLGQIAATAGNPPEEQARFNADGWYYLYLYERNRSQQQFDELIGRIQDGHITAPLNPMVTLYGALPTEAAIRTGYYPGRIERRYGIPFRIGLDMENATNPWGLASLWAGSGGLYTWKGICNCSSPIAPFANRTDEVFRWQGPDNRELLMKWYQIAGSNRSFGGYAEARDNLSQAAIQTAIDRFGGRPPFLSSTGLFGAGWDDVTYKSSDVVTLAQQWNAAHSGGDRVIVSNEVDYFQALESRRADLAVLRGGWGNDWDLWPAALTERTAETRRAIEQLRTAEALAAVVHARDAGFWPPRQAALETAFVDYFKYFEHTWSDGGVGIAYVVANKKTWAASIDTAVRDTDSAAGAAAAPLFSTPADEDRFVVFNPLAFERTDYADLTVGSDGPFVVTDLGSGAEVPSQIVNRDGQRALRILARGVPSLGYRTYRLAGGAPAAQPDAATVNGATIESDLYRVTLGGRGEITSAVDKAAGGRELARTALNDFGGGSAGATSAENVGPVSTTLVRDVGGSPPRRVRITLVREVDRIEIENEILANFTGTGLYRFDVNLSMPQIRFEETGAIARPGLAAQGGDFLPGTRADFMTLNHFVNLATGDYNVTLSSWDAFAVRIGQSSVTSFDLPTSEVSVLAVGNPSNSGIVDQGGDTRFLHRLALHGEGGAYQGAEAMRTALAHQNPLRALPLARGQGGPLSATAASFLSVSAPNVVVTAFKPAEEGERGLVVRLWELGGADTAATLNTAAFAPSAAFATSLIETDEEPATMNGGQIAVALSANEIKTYRFVPTTLRAGGSCGDADGSGTVTVTDGVLVLRAAAGLSSPCSPAVCDVDASGTITVTDGVNVLRAAALLPAQLTCP
jgi:alpha-mannosidase